MSDYDLFVIGGGSGGLAAAKRAAYYGARVAIAEQSLLGGTCAARGCVPKKLMVYASGFSQAYEDATGYGWSKVEPSFDWQKLIAAIDREIQRLDRLHGRYLKEAGVVLFRNKATFIDAHTLAVGEQKITADKILIAVGGKPNQPKLPGIEHAITSDQMFYLPQQPKRFAVVGGGYIGVEFAGIMNGLGSEVTQLIRGDRILHGFDDEIRSEVHKGMMQHGVKMLTNTEVKAIEKTSLGLRLHLSDAEMSSLMVDTVLFATGRVPKLAELGLETIGMELAGKAVAVNEYSQTNLPHIYAVGDCTDRLNLTPIAIQEGRAFADTVFGNKPHAISYKNIPTAVFGQPQAASVGLTEAEAQEQFGQDNITLYCTMFNPLFYSLTSRDEVTTMKLVVEKQTDRVVGAHMVGEHAAEIIQIAAIAVNAGLTKQQFDATTALHPTSAEEFVTLRMSVMPSEAMPPCWMAN